MVLAMGCGNDPASPKEDVALAEDLMQEDSPVSCLGAVCKTGMDCEKTGPCVAATNCVDGCCSYVLKEAGTACELPCMAGGECNGAGECVGTETLVCEEKDGNPCTVPFCDPKTGKCGDAEEPLPDGAAPMESSCWSGLSCKDGQVDQGAAMATALKIECDEKNAALDPFGCIEQVVCVDSMEECKLLLKPEGAQCWSEDVGGTGPVCSGRACGAAGECVESETFTVTCDDASYPEDCNELCKACTRLTCFWIPDPAGQGAAGKKIKYCQVAANVGDACDDGSVCTVGDACVLEGTAEGPMGKETLAICQPGPAKTKSDCLSELDLPELPCLKSGTACDPVSGCGIDQASADAWCLPPQAACVDEAQTWCSHIDIGDGLWNEATGCHVATSAGECDDGNSCTQDGCDLGGGCIHQPLNGGLCDDGNVTTTDDACQMGMCIGLPDADMDWVADSGYNGPCISGNTEACNDNCPGNPNPKQEDADGNGVGDGCICNANCTGKVCGNDGCGGSCGVCQVNQTCVKGQCVFTCDPVDGGWSDWTCGVCSKSCGGGTQNCTRYCNNPSPSCGGLDCVGSGTSTTPCNSQPCAACPNGSCEAGETCCTCPADCGGCCGNGLCDCNETNQSCAADCANPDGCFPACNAATETCAKTSSGSWACAPKLVTIPAGSFWMGCNNCEDSQVLDGECDADEHPYHEVYLDAYEIERTEVTVDQYAACVTMGACTDPAGTAYNPSSCTWQKPGKGNVPINCITWTQANEYCAWTGRKMCTEAQWEKGARGGCELNGGPANCKAQSRKYPWGNAPVTCQNAVTWECSKDPVAVCSVSPQGDSPYGLCDMVGNIWEWTADVYSPEYYCAGPDADIDFPWDTCQVCGAWWGGPAAWNNPVGPPKNPNDPPGGSWPTFRSTRGGGVFTFASSARVSSRYPLPGAFTSEDAKGFRCCR